MILQAARYTKPEADLVIQQNLRMFGIRQDRDKHLTVFYSSVQVALDVGGSLLPDIKMEATK